MLPLSQVALMTGLASDNLLHIEMREGMERASARYTHFQIDPAPSYTFAVDFMFSFSSISNSLTFQNDLPAGCKSIFEAPYDSANSCHFASPFGVYESATPGAGIHWGAWLGTGVSLDFIEMRFRNRKCSWLAFGLCGACNSGFAKRHDAVSGWKSCNGGVSSDNCILSYRRFSSNSCISASSCNFESRHVLSANSCLACHASCPEWCKGPLAEDCLLQTCEEIQSFYPNMATRYSYATVYYSGGPVPVWCEPSRWMTIIASDSSIDYSSLSFSNYENSGEVTKMPHNLFIPLDQVKAMTAARSYQIKFELTDGSGGLHYDTYGTVSFSGSGYTITLGPKLGSSASLAAFDLAAAINGRDF